MLSALRESLLNLLFPYDVHCPICRYSLIGGEWIICSNCEKELNGCLLTPMERISAHGQLARCISAFAYEGVARELIRQLKYHSDATIAPLLGQHMSIALYHAAPGQRWDAVIPVPLHPTRARERGYNQAQLLAQAVAAQYRFPLRTDLLFRIKAMASQTKRTAEQRRAAMVGVFAADPKVRGMRILLIDDVLTTGATACACEEALRAAGAAEVTLLTVCQA